MVPDRCAINDSQVALIERNTIEISYHHQLFRNYNYESYLFPLERMLVRYTITMSIQGSHEYVIRHCSRKLKTRTVTTTAVTRANARR